MGNEGQKHIHFGKRLRQKRLEKDISQEKLATMIGLTNNSYISDAENGRFIPSDEKMELWAKAIGITMEEVEDLKLEAEIERLGISDPSFTMMFKQVPTMNSEEKQNIIRAYEAVLKAREAKKDKRHVPGNQ